MIRLYSRVVKMMQMSATKARFSSVGINFFIQQRYMKHLVVGCFRIVY